MNAKSNFSGPGNSRKVGGQIPKKTTNQSGNVRQSAKKQARKTAMTSANGSKTSYQVARGSFRSHNRDVRPQTKTATSNQITTGPGLRIYPLGGQEEVGRNCTVFEYENDIVILDMGMQFSDEDHPGIDYIIPNVASLRGKEKNIRGVIFSHGHLDHIGAAPILLEQLGNPPIIGRKLTLAMVKHRQEDYKHGTTKHLNTIAINSLDDKLKLGKFNVSFFQVEHSIVDAVGVILQTPHGTVIHPGDWLIEDDPLQGKALDYRPLAKLPSPRILMLESLGVAYNNKRTPVKTTLANLENLISSATGRIIIGTFASQLERITHLLAYAEKIGKKVALDGYSMKMNVRIAQELGYIPPHKKTLISIEEVHKFPENKIVIICTGAQGEPNAVFSRIVNGSHRFINIKKSDTVLFSSSVIPGNERSIQKIKDKIYRMSDNVIHNSIMDIHSGGHANADDIKNILHQINPDYFLPVYANHYMLVEAKKLALREGFREDQVFVLDNGNIIEFQQGKKPQVLKEKVNTDYVMVDGLGVGDISEVVLRDRRMMSEDGMIVVIVTVRSKTGELASSPDLISRGFIHMKENKKLVEQTRTQVKTVVAENNPRHMPTDNFLRDKIRNEIGQFLFNKTKRRPMVLPVIIEV
ncbi:MAG: ribonuclease J [Candidatus Komeilibacteria bacterium]|nr:ribonuclease J [Candidatus Komeilibacteria bacterium]